MARKTKSIEDIEEVKVGEFTAKYFWAFTLVQLFLQKPSRTGKPFHVRGFHYWITKLAESFKKLPANNKHNQDLASNIDNNRLNDWDYIKGEFDKLEAGNHEYTNTASMHVGIDKALTQLRLRGFVDFEMIRDNKNDDAIARLEEQLAALGFYCDVDSLDSLSRSYTESHLSELSNFEVTINRNLTRSKFLHQDYFLLVVSEKDLYVEETAALCAKHGAEYIYFKGQPSLTRIAQVCFKAEKSGKPILLLYLADLDPAGLVMSNAFRKRMHQIYPRDDHIVKRVMLTRDQVVENGFPTMMKGEKKIPEKTMEWYIDKTGGDTMCELNALDEEEFIPILEAELEQYSGIDLDKADNAELIKKATAEKEEMESKIDLDQFKYEYLVIKEKHDTLADKINAFFESIAEESEELEKLKDEFRSKVQDHVQEIIEEVHPEGDEE